MHIRGAPGIGEQPACVCMYVCTVHIHARANKCNEFSFCPVDGELHTFIHQL